MKKKQKITKKEQADIDNREKAKKKGALVTWDTVRVVATNRVMKTPGSRTTDEFLSVRTSPGKGRGVYAKRDIMRNQLVNVAPLLHLTESEMYHLSWTKLVDYVFDSGDDSVDGLSHGEGSLALGLVSLMNHAKKPNCEYLIIDGAIHVFASRAIKRGEEVTISYGYEP